MLNEDLSSTTICLKNTTSRLCDTCRSTPGTIFCEADLAYLCTRCDSQIHAVNKLSSRHKRVRVCDACEQAPAAFICKADAASLCATCDAVIHSANPLSRRHHRVPVMPILGSVYLESELDHHHHHHHHHDHHNEDEDEAASWLVFDSPNQNDYLELVDYNSCQDTQFSDDWKFDDDYKYVNDGVNNNNMIRQQMYGGCDADSLVPVQKFQLHHHNFQNQQFQMGLEYETSNGGYASLGDSKPSRDSTRPLGLPSGLKGLLHALNAAVMPTKVS